MSESGEWNSESEEHDAAEHDVAEHDATVAAEDDAAEHDAEHDAEKKEERSRFQKERSDRNFLRPRLEGITKYRRNSLIKASNLQPSARCRGCRNRFNCSFYHGDDDSLSTQFCFQDPCTLKCPLPHPSRRRKKQISTHERVDQCEFCNARHNITFCPHVQCIICNKFGHTEYNKLYHPSM